MSKTDKKLALIKNQPNCARCGCKMAVVNDRQKSHMAILTLNNVLICFQCHRIETKLTDFQKLPKLKQTWIKFDYFTGIPTVLHKLKKTFKNFLYFRIMKGERKGRLPKYETYE